MATDKVWAVMMVKDESDVIDQTIMHLFNSGIDGLVVADNRSTDGTRAQIASLARHFNIALIDDDEIGYYQSRKITRLAGLAARFGAAWIIPVDADEIWYSLSDLNLADELRACPGDVISVPMWNHFCTLSDRPEGSPFERLVYRQEARNPLNKVAFRWCHERTIAAGNHHVLNASGQVIESAQYLIAIRHFPYRSARQFVNKARNGLAAYQAAPDLPESLGSHWRMYGQTLIDHGEEALIAHFQKHFFYHSPQREGMVYDPAPLKLGIPA